MVNLAPENRANRRRRPSGDITQTILALEWFGGWGLFGGQNFGDALQSLATVIQLKDASDHSGLDRIDHPLDVGAQRSAVCVGAIEHVLIRVSKHASTDHVARLGQSGMSFMHTVAGLLAVRLVRRRLHGRHRFI
ncbi:MAG TPA: hypothetical protein VNJ02_13000 [Vicinamibacterales bacterium]|nr:hypothetical protein [Vicinamibacterales bacterium]